MHILKLTCSTFRFIEDKGPAFHLLLKKMKEHPDKTLYVRGKVRKSMGDAAKE